MTYHRGEPREKRPDARCPDNISSVSICEVHIILMYVMSMVDVVLIKEYTSNVKLFYALNSYPEKKVPVQVATKAPRHKDRYGFCRLI